MLMRDPMNFCSNCGSKVAFRVPPGDHLPRYICDSCGTIHYQNPRVVVGCVPEHEGRILLCKRAIEPRKGYWTVPGRLHGERRVARAGRRSRRLRRSPGGWSRSARCWRSVSIIGAHQVHVFFRGKLARAGIRRGAGKPRGEARDARGDPVGRHRVPEHDLHAARSIWKTAPRAAKITTSRSFEAGRRPVFTARRRLRLSRSRSRLYFTHHRGAWHNAPARRLAGWATPKESE